MDKRNLLILAPVLIIAGVIFSHLSDSKEPRYSSRNSAKFQEEGISGAIQWWKERLADYQTGKIDPEAVRRAEEQLASFSSMKNTSSLLSFYEMGPDNIGGRTRAIIIDRNNYNILYAGSVSGGLWRSTTGGLSWNKVPYTNADGSSTLVNLKIVSMCQAINGDIYFGTGEVTGSLGGWAGQGVFKSSFAASQNGPFSQLGSTWTSSVQSAFQYVNKLAADQLNPLTIYAGTNAGLWRTTDGGATWERVATGSGISTSDMMKPCSDVKTSVDGTIVISINNKFYISTDNGVSFSRPSGSPTSPNGRLEFAIAPSDPNYIYCSAAAADGTLLNIQKSTDRGLTWTIILPGDQVDYEIFNSQGVYDNVIAVYPDNKDKIIVGGIDLWTKNAAPGNSENWQPISKWFFDPTDPLFVHADQHAIVFHPNYNGTTNKIIYFGTDGGIFQSLDGGYTFRNLNKNFNTIQFYAIGFDGFGHVGGGTQDNGTIYVDFLGNTPQNGTRIKGGDGGYTEFSMMNPNVTFATTYYGGLKRSEEKGKNFDDADNPVGKYFFSNRILNKYFGGLESNISDVGNAASFVTPIALHENFDDELSIDSVWFHNDTISMIKELWDGYLSNMLATHPGLVFDSLERENMAGEIVIDAWFTYAPNDYVNAKSATYARPLPILLTDTLFPGDSVQVKDTYQAILALGFNGNVWLTRKPLAFNISAPIFPWYPVAKFSGAGIPTDLNIGMVSTMAFSKDGNHLYFASDSRLFRVSNLNYARTQKELDADIYADSSTVLIETKLAKTFSQYITGIGIDPNNPDKVVVTLGSYNNAQVQYSSNATSNSPTFVSKMGNLPEIPVFTAAVDILDSRHVIIGTEYGIFSTGDITVANPVWEDQNTGNMQNVPVSHIRQQWHQNDWSRQVYNYGQFYFGTHGRGIFSDNDRPITGIPTTPGLNPAKAALKVFPNPATTSTTLSFQLSKSSDVEISVYSLQGKLVERYKFENQAAGLRNIPIATSEFSKGVYLVKLSAGNLKLSSKLIIQ